MPPRVGFFMKSLHEVGAKLRIISELGKKKGENVCLEPRKEKLTDHKLTSC